MDLAETTFALRRGTAGPGIAKLLQVIIGPKTADESLDATTPGYSYDRLPRPLPPREHRNQSRYSATANKQNIIAPKRVEGMRGASCDVPPPRA